MKDILKEAREYEIENRHLVDPERPAFHLTAPVGWMNDPNGFSNYKGEAHLFFQYYPYDTIWGKMHWGHAKTKDFVKWEHLPMAVAPDMPYDQNGCFSGGAIELEDGRQLIMYSGVTPLNYNIEEPVEDLPPESDRYQNQCICIGDGVNYEKIEGNPVLVASTVPEGGSLVDFRDPKIIKEGDKYYIVISNRPASGNGDILLYESDDCLHWSFVSVLISNDGSFGRMWECPDLFVLDDEDVMLVSPMEMEERGLDYHQGHICLALIGEYDRETHTFKDELRPMIDYGINFYSTQSLETEDGRRIMVAWMMNWKERDITKEGLHFFGQMTLPRELHIRDKRLIQNPVREIEDYRQNKVAYEDVALSREMMALDGINGRILDMTIQLTPGEAGYQKFAMELAKKEEKSVTLEYDPAANIITVDRRNCGGMMDQVGAGKFYVDDHQGALKLRMLMDKYSVEIFVNDGEQAATYTFYNDLSADGMCFGAEGDVTMNVVKYDLVVE